MFIRILLFILIGYFIAMVIRMFRAIRSQKDTKTYRNSDGSTRKEKDISSQVTILEEKRLDESEKKR